MSENQTEVVKFLNYLSNPNALGGNDLVEIKDWVSKYPYSQSLKFIAAKAAAKSANYQDLIAQAATIAPSRKTLYHLIHQSENFISTILPFSIDDEQTIEERQSAVSSEENLDEVEDQSKLSFGINLNEIYGSEYQTEKTNEISEIENIEEKGQEIEEVLAVANEEQVAEVEEIVADVVVEDIDKESQESEEDSAIADEEEVEEIVADVAVEDIDKESQIIEEVSATTDEEEVAEDIAAKNMIEETQIEEAPAIADEEEVLATADEEQAAEDIAIENIEEETQKSENLSTSIDNEQVAEVEEIAEDIVVDNIEEKTQEEEVLAYTNEEQVAEVENIVEETLIEEAPAIADEEQAAEDIAIEVIEEETQESEEVSATADEKQIEKIAEDVAVENIEEEISIENIKEEKPTQIEEPAFQYAPQTDFFALNRKDKVEEKKAEELVEKAIKTDESVSAYNDERMPYTFLWWLNKTRKEHANTQPYSSFKLDTSKQIKKQEIDGLNHQIAENIFHLRGVEELSSSAKNYTVPFDFRKKEFQIIEKFIKEEPQIRPPAANKIDSENKAKKSSEDNNQVVSETLAKIYVEQMLYHKALDVYKKLSLKYPEKSTYFASQIKYLELKVN